MNRDDSSDDENYNDEIIEQLDEEEKRWFQEAHQIELNTHPFNKYYENSKHEFDFARNLRATLHNFTHEKALRFVAKTRIWYRRNPPTEVRRTALPRVKAVYQFIYADNVHAIYRVISEKKDKYILMACHMNVHGFRRGDLRFVEVNNRTKTTSSSYSCIGHLGLGDLVAVTELARTDAMGEFPENVDVNRMTQESPCLWMVKRMTVFRRQKFKNVPFSFLNNGTAVAYKWGQVLTVRENTYAKTDNMVFEGTGFIPMEVAEWAGGLTEEQEFHLIGATRNIKKYPISTGTIMSHFYSHRFTQEMQIGLSAYRIRNPDPDGILQLCALMGATAVAAVLSGNFDCRSFKIMNPSIDGEFIHFFIDNEQEPKAEGLWKPNGRITIGSTRMNANAVIETVSPLGKELKIVARLSTEHLGFELIDEIHMVSQREMPEGTGLRDGFLENIPQNSNGKMIIRALYGGAPIPAQPLQAYNKYFFPSRVPIALNQYQNEYIDRLLQKTPITLANSPFGSGKSMTIATAAYYAVLESRAKHSKTPGDKHTSHLLVTQSNFASVNLAEITKNYTNKCRVVRYVSEADWLELPEEGRTEMDLPNLMKYYFMEFVTGRIAVPTTDENIKMSLFNMAIFLKENNVLAVDEMCEECRNHLEKYPNARKYDFSKLTVSFFKSYNPEVVITTSDSLRSVLPALEHVSTVQFDEASQIPECAFIQVLATFPHAYFGLVGDIHQLPPYCDYLLTGHLKTFGIGNTMERAVQNNLFPQVVLRYVYRCHPTTTEILGNLFYGGNLIPGVTAEDRNEMMTNRIYFWPNRNFPIMIVNNDSPSQQLGRNTTNPNELSIVRNIVHTLTSPIYNNNFNPRDVGIISFYKAQSNLLVEQFRDLKVKCGTVDSFQGQEKEIMILCCTNEVVTGFLEMKNRINVAMSRAKQATIVIGNVSGLLNANYWNQIVQLAHKNNCVKIGR